MNVVSTNLDSDPLILTCGNSDDGRIKVWNIVERQMIFHFPEPCSACPYYNLNVLRLDVPSSNKQTRATEKNSHSEDDNTIFSGNTSTIIFATSNKDVCMFEINRDGTVSLSGPFKVEAEMGSYLATSFVSKVTDLVYTLVVSNISGDIESFDCVIESSEKGSVFSPKTKQRAIYSSNSPGNDKDNSMQNNPREGISINSDQQHKLEFKPKIESKDGRKFSHMELSKTNINMEEGGKTQNNGEKIIRGLIEIGKKRLTSPELKERHDKLIWQDKSKLQEPVVIDLNKDKDGAGKKSKTTSNE